MKKFEVPSREDVSAQNQSDFDALKKALGMVPNLYATIAYSENGLSRYLAFQGAKTSLGFDDEFYFSRFLKTNADVSPQLYRETVGFSTGEA